MNRKQLVKEKCANYKGGFCLIRDIECPLVTPFEYHGHRFPCNEVVCSYFDKYVLGIDKDKAATRVHFSYKKCGYCGNQYRPSSNASKYCSESCREIANKKSHRKYNTKRR